MMHREVAKGAEAHVQRPPQNERTQIGYKLNLLLAYVSIKVPA